MAHATHNNPPNQSPYPPYAQAEPPTYATYTPYQQSEQVASPRGSHPTPYTTEHGESRTPIPPGYEHHPVYEAVNEAFAKSEPVQPPNTTSSQLPPELIQQITDQVRTQVLNELKANPNVSLPAMQTTQQPIGPPAIAPPVLAPQSQVPVASTHSASFDARAYDDDTGSDSGIDAAPPEKFERQERYEPRKEDLSDRLGDLSVPFDERLGCRPRARRIRTDEEETAVERAWQPLFDEAGRPTLRLGQFIRGLALHLVEDYEPKNSLVIAPHKMNRFYEDAKVDKEYYPWRDLFTRLPHVTLSRIYLALGCQHHYIPMGPNAIPTVPALTPDGFFTWMLLLIEAHPETEFDRLSIAVRDMPLSNADDRAERWPKELSRRLLPKHHNSEIRRRCAAALLPPPPAGASSKYAADHQKATPLHTSASQSTSGQRIPSPARVPPRQISPARAGTQATVAPIPISTMKGSPPLLERTRTPYSASIPGGESALPSDRLAGRERGDSIRSENLSADEVDRRTGSVVSEAAAMGMSSLERRESVPIERERKPYVAREGQGKVYEAERASGSDSGLRPPPSASAAAREPGSDWYGRRRANSTNKYNYASIPPPSLSSSLPNGNINSFGSALGRSNSLSVKRAGPYGRSDGRERSPASVTSSNGGMSGMSATSSNYVPPAVYSGSEEDYDAGSDPARDQDRGERRRRRRQERQRERDSGRNREREGEAFYNDEERYQRRDERGEHNNRGHEHEREREHERDRERSREHSERRMQLEREREREEYDRREYDRRERERDRDRERERDYERERERGREHELRRERDRAEREHRRAPDERSRYDVDNDDNLAASSYPAPQSDTFSPGGGGVAAHHPLRRSVAVPGPGGYGSSPLPPPASTHLSSHSMSDMRPPIGGMGSRGAY